MQSTNSIPSLEDLIWLPPVSQNLSQGDLNAITPSNLGQSNTLQPYEFAPTLSNNPSQTSIFLSNDGQRHPQSEDLEIEEEAEAQVHDHHPADHQNIPKPVSGRSKYGNLDWDRHEEELRTLYLVENHNLDNTMRIMKERHSFPESYVHAFVQYELAC